MKNLLNISATMLFFAASQICGCNCKKATAASLPEKENISLFKVPLVCGAAPQIGCGSKSKPVLLGLEKKKDVVNEAWLNRAGTVIAIVWNDNASSELRTAAAAAVFTENKLDVEEVKGKEYKKMRSEFESRKDWLRGVEVDRLSEEEASVIAERLIKRISDKVTLTEEKKYNLKNGITSFFKKCLTKNYGSEINSNQNKVMEKFKTQTENELLGVGKKYLNEPEINALKDAIALGIGPLESECKESKPCYKKKGR